MPLPIYLAMTQAEFNACPQFPRHCGWMACHFSSYGPGLTNLPRQLPDQSLLIVNDRTPPQGHDPEYIAMQLQNVTRELPVMGVLLDFQRPYNEETDAIAKAIAMALPCPVAVPPEYERQWDGPLFLPPVPPDRDIGQYLAPWKGRELWLELSPEGLLLRLTESGCESKRILPPLPPYSFQDETLCCHYSMEVYTDYAAFYLQRTAEDQAKLLLQAESYGVTTAVGLYQEACSICPADGIESDRPHNKEAGYGKHLS